MSKELQIRILPPFGEIRGDGTSYFFPHNLLPTLGTAACKGEGCPMCAETGPPTRRLVTVKVDGVKKDWYAPVRVLDLIEQAVQDGKL